MRKIPAVLVALFLVAAGSSTLSAQQSVYMLVDSIKGDQPAPHDSEFRVNSVSSGAANATTFSSTGGLAAGKPSFSPVKVSMRFHAGSTAAFYRFLALGKRIPSVEIRFYNSSNRVFYKTVYENVFLTNLSSDAADEAMQQVEFNFMRVRWFAPPDPAGLNPPVQTGCWDIALLKTC